jgi:hypothetical protein
MKGKVRSIATVLVGLVAVVGLLTSVIALWARDVLFDSSEVAAAAESALAEPEVTAALATRLTDLAFEAADVEARLTELVPDNLQVMVPALVGGAHAAVESRLEARLADEDTRAIVVALVEGSHERLMRLLVGDGILDGVSVVDGEVRLNLLPLVGFAFRTVQDLGYLADRELPPLTADGDPVEQVAALEAAFGRDLPDDFGQLTVYRSDALADAGQTVATAQRAVVVARRALIAVLAVTVLAYAGCVLLARRRRRAVLALSLASVAVMLVARAIIRAVLEEAPTVALDPAGRAAITATLGSLTRSLFVLLTLTVLLGVVVAIVAFLRSENRAAVRLRGATGSTGQSVSGLIARNRGVVGFAAFALAVAVIAVGGFGTARVVIAGVLAAIGVWAIWSSDDPIAAGADGSSVPDV